MKVSLNWVKQYTDVDLPVDKLLDKIGAQLGAVEEVVNLGERYKGIVVAKVVSCKKHPNADKLSLCLIDDGGVVKGLKRTDGLVQVVCGAPNVKAGQLVAWLPSGVTVPSTFSKDPLVLEAREIRGQISNGMLASAKELTIGDSHEGILVIDKKTRPGANFAKLYGLDDYIIDIENKMFTHRPDLFGMLGVAREIAGIQGKRFKSPGWYVENPKLRAPGSKLSVQVKNELPKLVPRFMAVVLEGILVGPSPIWLQSRLSRLGVRPINNIVDATNYFMLLSAQPLHAYDLDKLKTGVLGVRLSKNDEQLKLIGGKEIKLQSGAVVITDGQRPIGLGGVMGGADTEVDSGTKNIILECATFDMNLTRKTAFTHGLFSDAATRFTKGQSPRQNAAVLAEAVKAILDLAGGSVGKLTDNQSLPKPSLPVHVPARFINERLGLSLGAIEMKRLLDNVEFGVRRDAGKLAVTSPFWRTDIEIPEDIVEEVGRLHGYDHLPLALPKRDLSAAKINPRLKLKAQLRDILSRAGANEALTYSFVDGSLIEKAGQDVKEAFHIRNALSPDLQYYRLSLTPSLLEKIHPNIKAGYGEFGLFEMGKVYSNKQLDKQGLPKEFDRLALVLATGDKLAKQTHHGSPFFWAKFYASYLFNKFNLEPEYKALDGASLKSHAHLRQMLAPFERQHSAGIWVGDQLAGIVGEYKSEVRQALKLPAYCAGLEVSLSSLPAEAIPVYTPLNRYPSLELDLCLRVSHAINYEQITDFVGEYLDKLASEHGLGGSLEPLDIYQKKEDKAHKQITWRISFWHPQRTLTTAEVNKLIDGLASEAKVKFKAERI